MVTTRSSGASSLEVLQTPSKPKRRRTEDDSESQDENETSKRARTTSNDLDSEDDIAKIDPFFMFPKKDLSDDEEALARSAPPKSYAEIIRRERRLRQLRKKNNPFGTAPRRPLFSTAGQNPFGIEDDVQPRNVDTPTSLEHHERDERSAAPEPETPKHRSLFGSLRTLGSATIGRAQSLFGSLTPRSGTTTPQAGATSSPRVRNTEPRRMKTTKPVWEIEYPELPKTPDSVEEDDEEETESEKKRRAFEAEYGVTDRDYDHLHTESITGNPDDLPYPIKKKPPQQPPKTDEELGPARASCRQERKKLNMERFGLVPPKQLPKIAPLFGPNSHSARKTVDPRMKELKETGVHPADREFDDRNRKRKAETALMSESQVPSSLQATSRTFQPSVEDDLDIAQYSEDNLSTPVAKRQKTTHQIPQTPRSAMKPPGSIGRRTGRSVMFNANPVDSIKRMTPPTNTSPAGTYNPNSLFKTFADDERDRRAGLVQGSPSSDISMDPSPNTRQNTFLNSQVHPGDALTNAINDANPRKIDYMWRDPSNPEWRPSLANPQPGTFRFVPEEDEDDEMEMLAEIEREETSKSTTQTSTTPEAEAPQPPSTPRMSHAELPKPASSTQNPATSTPTTPSASASASASALEAANLERRRAEAAKTRPKTSSRLAEVTSARSRSPSPPGLDTENLEGTSPSPTDSASAAKTPSPIQEQGSWTWTDETNEYIAANPRHPDFAYNAYGELTPSLCLRDSSGDYDDVLVGPDGFTELTRQAHYRAKYDDEWAKEMFPFDPPMTYEESGVGTRHIHELIRKNDAMYPELVERADRRFKEEWEEHGRAIEGARSEGKRLVAVFPDRDGEVMQDEEME